MKHDSELKRISVSCSVRTRETKTKGVSLWESHEEDQGSHPIVAMCRTSLIVRISTYRRRHHKSSARGSNPSNLCHPPTLAYADLEVMGGLWNCQSAVKEADSISAYIPNDPPLPGPDRDLDQSREFCYSFCPLQHLLILSHPKTIMARRRDRTPYLAKVVLPGPSSRTLGQICI